MADSKSPKTPKTGRKTQAVGPLQPQAAADSEYRYMVQFSGMIAMVPSATGNVNYGRMRMLVVDAGFRNQDTTGEELFPHVPFLHFDIQDLHPDNLRQPDLTGNGHGVCLLNREEVMIGGQVCSPGTLEYTLTSPASGKHSAPGPQGAPTAEDLGWVMPMPGISNNLQGGPEIDSACLDMPYAPTPQNRLAARLRLCQGRLYNRDFRRKTIHGERLVSPCAFSFGQHPPHLTQTISTMVTYEPLMPAGNDPLEIASMRFPEDAGQIVPSLKFRSPRELGRDVVINLWNAPLSVLLDLLGRPEYHEAWPRPRGDRSFRAFYRLADTPPTTLPKLTREEVRPISFQPIKTSDIKGVGCPLAMYPVHANA